MLTICLVGLNFFAEAGNTLQLKSGNYVLKPNIDQIQESDLSISLYNSEYYVYVHFQNLPTNAQKKQLLENGVVLMDYVPSSSFQARIKKGTNLTSLSALNIDGVYLILPEFKMSYQVATESYPEHAMKGSKVTLVVQNQEGIDAAKMDAIYREYGAKVSGHYEFSQLTTLTIAKSRVRALATHPMVKFLEPIAPDATPEDTEGQSNHRMNYISNATVNSVPYNGAGVWIAIGDDGELGPHIDYTGRMDQSSVGASSGSHGDHVSGIMMGAGNVDPDGRGMAWGANIKVYDVWDAVNSTPTSYVNPGVVVTSTSYGNGCNAGYTTFAQTADRQVRTMPNLMHVFSAGNSGTSDCGYGAGNGWGNITGGIKAGKNVLAVGNVTVTDGLAASSSRGPASDGRIKPDICANGTQVYSCFPNNQYVNNTGTSMAAPGVSGSYGALVQAYKELNNNITPPSALVKAAMLNTADDLGNVGPDFKFGWGRLNARKVVDVFKDQTFIVDSISQGGANSHSITVPAGVKQIKIMVYWNDYEGSTSSVLALVNNLDMTVTDPSATVFQPYILNSAANAASLNSPATHGVDSVNNMEQVVIDNPAMGSYSVQISGSAIPQGPQTYYVIYEFITDEIVVTYPIGGEGFVPGQSERIRWDAVKGTNTFTAEYSTDNGSTWNVISNSIGASNRSYSFTVPNVVTGKARVKISRNGVSGQSILPFSIIGVPTNLNVTSSCPNSFTLDWNAVAGATSYEVSMLGAKYMDSVMTVTTNTATITGVDASKGHWVSVKAKTTDAIGKRAIAIQKLTGVWNCSLANDIGISQAKNASNVFFNCSNMGDSEVSVLIKNGGTTSKTNVNLSYQYNSGTVVSETYNGVINPGDSVSFSFSQTIAIPSTAGQYPLIIWQDQPDDNVYNDTLNDLINVFEGASQTLPYTEDFESFSRCATTSDCGVTVCNLTNGWTNATSDDVDFRANTGGTPSNGTGPDMDYFPGNAGGTYLYIESSGDCAEMEGQVFSPCFDFTDNYNPMAKIWYHMRGSDMGDLHFDVLADGEWNMDVISAISGDQGALWQEATIDLTAFAAKQNVVIRFRAVTGSGWRSDIAIDSFGIEELAPLGTLDESGEFSDLAIFPNPSTGKFTLKVAKDNNNPVSLTIMDMKGIKVYEKSLVTTKRNFQEDFDLSSLSKGVYILNLSSNEKVRQVRIIIK
tara:strand:+ start:54070 stop:57651 length:3582 start_codon:yes stop_codon:yes gene_type:complete